MLGQETNQTVQLPSGEFPGHRRIDLFRWNDEASGRVEYAPEGVKPAGDRWVLARKTPAKIRWRK